MGHAQQQSRKKGPDQPFPGCTCVHSDLQKSRLTSPVNLYCSKSELNVTTARSTVVKRIIRNLNKRHRRNEWGASAPHQSRSLKRTQPIPLRPADSIYVRNWCPAADFSIAALGLLGVLHATEPHSARAIITRRHQQELSMLVVL